MMNEEETCTDASAMTTDEPMVEAKSPDNCRPSAMTSDELMVEAKSPDNCRHGAATTEFNLNRKIFVGNISYRVGTRRLSRFFSKFGAVEYCYVVQDHLKKWSKGTAFITFKTEESMRNALRATEDQLILDQRQMRVQPAEISHKATYWQPSAEGRNDAGVTEEVWDDDSANPKEAWDDQDVLETTTATTTTDTCLAGDFTEAPPPTPASINMLFDELLLGILGRLSMQERIGVERVCWRWRRLVQRSWHIQRHIHFQNCFKGFNGLTDRTLNSVLSRCGPYIRSLDLSASPRLLTDFAMDIIGKYCSDIEKLDLSNVKVTDRSMSNLVNKCAKLQWVRLRSCIYLQDKGIRDLLKGSPELQYLDVTDMFNITGQCFKCLGEKTQTVLAANCHQLEDSGVHHIVRRAPGLCELNLSHCHTLTDATIVAMCQSLSNLKCLNINGTLSKDPDETVRYEPAHLDVQCLQMLFIVTSGALCSLQHLEYLEELNASFNSAVVDQVLVAVSTACTQLRILDISGCHQGVTDVGIVALCNLRALHTINLSYLSQVTDMGMLTLSHHLTLTKLVARDTKFMTDEVVISLVTLSPDLNYLDLSGCFQVTNTIFQAFNDSPVDANRPVHLFLGGTSVDWVAEDIDWLRGFFHLNVSMHNLAVERLRPDRELMLPADDDEYEEENEYGAHPPLSDFEVGTVEECRDWQDADSDGYDEFLENDDPLEMERWEFS